MNPVLGKISSVFEYVRDAAGKPTGATHDRLSEELSDKLARGCLYRVTAKVDGTCCWIHGGALWARQDLKKGRKPPPGWVATAGDEPDAGGHLIGFRPLDPAGGSDKWHHQALLPDGKAVFVVAEPQGFSYVEKPLSDYEGATVELIGPKIQGNPHGLTRHALVVHGSIQVTVNGWRTHDALKKWLTESDGMLFEGIVIHCADGSLYKCHRGHLGLDGDALRHGAAQWPVTPT